MEQVEGRRISVRGVLATMLGVCRRNALPFGFYLLLLSIGPSILFGLPRLAAIEAGETGEVTFQENLIFLILGIPLSAALTQGALADLLGGRAQIGKMASAAWDHLLQVTMISIVTGVAVSVGLVILIVPGLILGAMWSVAIPVRLQEGGGLNAVLARSASLSQGNRTPIALLILLLLLLGAATYLGLAWFADVIAPEFIYGEGAWILVLAVEPIFVALSALLLPVGSAVIYAALKRRKEGGFGDEMVRVFD